MALDQFTYTQLEEYFQSKFVGYNYGEMRKVILTLQEIFGRDMDALREFMESTGSTVTSIEGLTQAAINYANESKTIAQKANDKSDITQKQLDQVTGASTIDPAVSQMKVDTEGVTHDSPDERLRSDFHKTENYLNDITFNIKKYLRLEGETDDADRVFRLIDAMPENATLLIPHDVTLDFAGRTFPISKKIKIYGNLAPKYDEGTESLEGGSLLLNTIVRFLTDGIEVENIGVQTTMSDAFQANTTSVKGIRLKHCIAIASAHCYLFESYNGLVSDVICEDCSAYDATHGFIAKATSVKFRSCKAYNCTTNGFGWIADNIPGIDKPAINKDGIGESCYANNCQSGFTMYSRDYFSTNNANTISMSHLNLDNCTAENCQFGVSVGDPNSAPTGQTYNEVLDITITNFKEIVGARSVYSFRLLKSRRVKITNPTIDKAVFYDRTLARDYVYSDPSSKTGSLGNIEDIQTLDINNATPTLNYLGVNSVFKTANTATTAIAGFLNSRKRGTVMILIDDDFTSVIASSSISLKRDRYEGKGSWVVLKYDNTKWVELYGFSASKKTIVRSLDSASGALEVNRTSLWEVQFSNSTTKTISLTGSVVDSPRVNVLIRKTTGGTGTFGGFDSSIGNAAAAGSSVTFGTALYVTLQYIDSLSKWFVVDVTNITY